jgi:sterol-4alpha-carboxylate 3-dehydrogenase (decarboxylating)
VDESSPVLFSPQQPNYYSHTKAVAEKIVLGANLKVNGMLTALRLASMYLNGEGNTTQILNLVKNARSGRAKMYIGSEVNGFDNTYFKNLTYAANLEHFRKASASKAGHFL